MIHVSLLQLGEERFGERLSRARGRRGIGLREASTLVSRFMPTSHATLARLEREHATPSGARRRATAALYAVALGYHPGEFGLTMDDLPPDLDPDVVTDRLSRFEGSLTSEDSNLSEYVDSLVGSALAGAA